MVVPQFPTEVAIMVVGLFGVMVLAAIKQRSVAAGVGLLIAMLTIGSWLSGLPNAEIELVYAGLTACGILTFTGMIARWY